MRFYRPHDLSPGDTWAENHQIVLPCSVRRNIMDIALEGFDGHLGILKNIPYVAELILLALYEKKISPSSSLLAPHVKYWEGLIRPYLDIPYNLFKFL